MPRATSRETGEIPADPCVGILQDGQESIDKDHKHGQLFPNSKDRDAQGQQRHAGNGLHHVGHRDDHRGELFVPSDEDTQRDPDHQGQQNRQTGHR